MTEKITMFLKKINTNWDSFRLKVIENRAWSNGCLIELVSEDSPSIKNIDKAYLKKVGFYDE